MEFPIVREKKMGTMAGTRVLCTQYLLRLATNPEERLTDGFILQQLGIKESIPDTGMGVWENERKTTQN